MVPLAILARKDHHEQATSSTSLLHVPIWEITKPEGIIIQINADKPEPMDDGGVQFTVERNGSRIVVDEFDADSWSSYMQRVTV